MMLNETEEHAKARREALHEAIQDVIHKFASETMHRGVLTTWALAAEMVGDDGEPYMQCFFDVNSGSWRNLGLVEVMRLEIQGAIRETDEDD